jgi:orotate phosphoribosyltransferase
MQDPRQPFLEFALRTGALAFGEFTTKGGRKSPYFFNAGRFDHGASLRTLAGFYADAALRARDEGRIAFDMLFGPAYKGIALAAAMAIALAERGLDVPFSYNRKEAKSHGEGGTLVGAPLRGRVLIVDDVITDGAAKRESVELIRAQGAQPAGVVISLDRQERTGSGESIGEESAVQAFERETGTPVISVADLADLLVFLRSDSPLAKPARAFLPAVEQYRRTYGVL